MYEDERSGISLAGVISVAKDNHRELLVKISDNKRFVQDTLDTALEEALSVLQAGGAEARRQLLDADALHALATPSAAFLWATSLEATEDTVSSVSTMATAIVKSCSDIAAVLFESALGL